MHYFSIKLLPNYLMINLDKDDLLANILTSLEYSRHKDKLRNQTLCVKNTFIRYTTEPSQPQKRTRFTFV